MPKLADNTYPSYRLHKQSGQAIVTLSGRDHLLGPHGSEPSRAKYDRLIAEWISRGRRQLQPSEEPPPIDPAGPLVEDICKAFWLHARVYYRDTVIETSANLRSSHNVEQATVINDPGLYHFHHEWIAELMDKAPK